MTLPRTYQTGGNQSHSTYSYQYVGGPLAGITAYDESGNAIRQVSYQYGNEGEILGVGGSTEPAQYSYDGLYRMTALADGNGHTTHYNFTPSGYLDSITYPGYIGSAFPNVSGPDSVHYPLYDNDGNPQKRIDGNGVETDYTYTDPESLLTTVHYPGGQLADVSYAYDTYDRAASMTDGTGSTAYEGSGLTGYDDLDNPLSVQTTYSGVSARAIGYSYNNDGSRSTMSVPGRNYNYNYDVAGRLTNLMNNFGEAATWSYQNNNWLLSQTDSNGLQITPTFNPLGQLIDLKNTSSIGLLSEFGSPTQSSGILHDGVGNITSVPASVPNTALGGTTNYQYDYGQTANASLNRDQLTQESSSRGSYTNTFGYDPAGNTSNVRGVGSPGYNVNNQTTTPLGINLASSYDGNGNPSAAHGAALTFDAENRLTVASAQTSSSPTRLAVGSDGLLRQLWNNADGSMRLTVVNATSGSVVSDTSYGPYAGWTAVSIAVGGNGATRILWNNSDGRISVWNMTDAQPASTCLVYGPFAGWTALTIAAGPDNTVHILWNHAPDNMMSLGTINNATHQYSGPSYGPYSGWAVKDLTVDAGSVMHVLWTNVSGQVSLWNMADAQPSATCQVYYPAGGWTGQSISAGPAGDPRIHLQWANTAGQVLLWTINPGSAPLSSPAFGAYPGWRPVQIAMDANNLTRLFWSNVNGTVNLWSVQPDNTHYAVLPALTPTAVAGTGASFGYRGDGLRAWKQNSAGVRTYYLYDGSAPVMEFNSSGQITGENMYGANGLISRNNSTSGTLFYAFDERGNVAERVSSTGSVASTDLYDAFGQKLAGNPGFPGSPNGDPYGFGGQAGYYTDAETGLCLLTHRYYDPGTGRFLTRDPLGYGGGINLYSYTQNNPGNEMDPDGTSFWGAVSAGATTVGIVGGVVLIGGAAVVSAPVLLTAIAVGAVVGTAVSYYGSGDDFGTASADGLLGASIIGDLTPPVLNSFGSEMQVRPGTIHGDFHVVYGVGDDVEHAVQRPGTTGPMNIQPMDRAYGRIFKPSGVTLHLPIAYPGSVMNPGGKAMNCTSAAGAAWRRGILGK